MALLRTVRAKTCPLITHSVLNNMETNELSRCRSWITFMTLCGNRTSKLCSFYCSEVKRLKLDKKKTDILSGCWFSKSKNVKIKIYRDIILPVVCMGVKLGRSRWGRNVGWGCLRIGCWGEYLGLRGTRWPGSGENYIMRSLICTAHLIYFVW